jgi:hypothetical protein
MNRAKFMALSFRNQPWQTPFLPWPFPQPQKEANTSQTPAEYVKITTSFIGNFTAFQHYMDGYGLQGMHAATHLVGPSEHQNSLVVYDTDCALHRALEVT